MKFLQSSLFLLIAVLSLPLAAQQLILPRFSGHQIFMLLFAHIQTVINNRFLSVV
jgi:hypothetical protein